MPLTAIAPPSWPGARWWRVDLHAVTNVAADALDPVAWLERYRDAGIDGVAVTDPNTAAAVRVLQQARTAVPGAPVIFPGVRITASDGCELLFVFDPSASQDHVQELLVEALIPVDSWGRPDARSRSSVDQLVELGTDRRLVLGAGVNGPRGLLALHGRVDGRRLAGVEVDPELPLEKKLLEGSRRGRRPVAQIWCGDPADPGGRFTWMKTTRLDLDGLRLALLDGATSLRPALRGDPVDPNRHGDQVIRGITVVDARHLGHPQPFTLQLNPWMNAVIGGRGTGKSTLVDLLRKAMRRDDELPGTGEDSALRAQYDTRMKVTDGKTGQGLLTAGTRVEVTYEKDGTPFVVSWDPGGKAPAVERIDGDQRIPEHGHVAERFPVRIYGQKQLFELARDPQALLRLIDDASSVRASEITHEQRALAARFLSHRASARELAARAAALPARQAVLGDARRKVEVLQRGSHAETFGRVRDQRRVERAWDEALAGVRRTLQQLAAATDGLGVSDVPGAELAGVHRVVVDRIDRLRTEVRAALAAAHQDVDAAVAGPDVARWREVLAEGEAAYQAVLAELSGAGIENPDEVGRLVQTVTALERELQALETQVASGASTDDEARRALDQYRVLRAELSERRRRFADEEASTELVRFTLRPLGRVEDFEAALRETLGIQRFDDAHRAMVERVIVDDGFDYGRLDALVDGLRGFQADPDASFPNADKRFEAALRRVTPERVDRLALYVPDDRLEVTFQDPRESRWKPLGHGSPGQQSAALLSFVLGYGSEPIVLDQPEDDLDNTLIYDLLVRRLRASKVKRQILVVTHNPNIVVHGDAELVVSLDVTDGRTVKRQAGGLQEQATRDEICRVMEGGREAFDRRYERIRGSRDEGS